MPIHQGAMIQVLFFLLIAARGPIEDASTALSAVPNSARVMAGPGGTRKPSKPPKRSEPNEPGSRPVNKNRCLDSAAAGSVVWTAFCRDIKDASLRKRCFEVALESEQRRKGFCNNFF